MNNQKGFFLPMTLGIVLVTFFILTASIEIYLSEQKYLKETKDYYFVNSMNLIAVKKITNAINERKFSESGSIVFENGTVQYSVKRKEDDVYIIYLNSSNNHNPFTKNEILYNKKTKQVLKWFEK
ncbi:competence type IV pilus minor pilin ComGG [Heyndrickxia sporothermodurans]